MVTLVYTKKGKLNGESHDIEGEPAKKLGRNIESLARKYESAKTSAAEFNATLTRDLAPYEKPGMEIGYVFGLDDSAATDFALRLGEPSWFGWITDEDQYMGQMEDCETILDQDGRLYELDEEFEETGLSIAGKTLDSLDACYIPPIYIYGPTTISEQPLTLKSMKKQLKEMSTAMESCSGF